MFPAQECTYSPGKLLLKCVWVVMVRPGGGGKERSRSAMAREKNYVVVAKRVDHS